MSILYKIGVDRSNFDVLQPDVRNLLFLRTRNNFRLWTTLLSHTIGRPWTLYLEANTEWIGRGDWSLKCKRRNM